LTFEGGPDGFAEKAVCLVMAWPQNPSGWRSHERRRIRPGTSCCCATPTPFPTMP